MDRGWGDRLSCSDRDFLKSNRYGVSGDSYVSWHWSHRWCEPIKYSQCCSIPLSSIFCSHWSQYKTCKSLVSINMVGSWGDRPIPFRYRENIPGTFCLSGRSQASSYNWLLINDGAITLLFTTNHWPKKIRPCRAASKVLGLMCAYRLQVVPYFRKHDDLKQEHRY